MRTTFLTLAMVALTFSTMNATEMKVNETVTVVTSTTINSIDDLVQVYNWTVTTNKSTYSGTAASVEEAQKMIALSSSGEIVLEKKIESYYLDQQAHNDSSMKLYFWEVETTNGTAKGFSSTEAHAKRMIELVASGSIIQYKIVQSGIINK